MSKNNAEYMLNYIAKELVGWKITSEMYNLDDDGEGYYGFIVKKGKVEKNVWVMRDEEGNGPGFLNIQTQSQAEHGDALICYVNLENAIFANLDNLGLTGDQKSRVREIYEHDFQLATSGPYCHAVLKEMNEMLGAALEKVATSLDFHGAQMFNA